MQSIVYRHVTECIKKESFVMYVLLHKVLHIFRRCVLRSPFQPSGRAVWGHSEISSPGGPIPIPHSHQCSIPQAGWCLQDWVRDLICIPVHGRALFSVGARTHCWLYLQTLEWYWMIIDTLVHVASYIGFALIPHPFPQNTVEQLIFAPHLPNFFSFPGRNTDYTSNMSAQNHAIYSWAENGASQYCELCE